MTHDVTSKLREEKVRIAKYKRIILREKNCRCEIKGAIAFLFHGRNKNKQTINLIVRWINTFAVVIKMSELQEKTYLFIRDP